MTILTAADIEAIREREQGCYLFAKVGVFEDVRALLRHIDALSSRSSLSPSAPGVEAEALELGIRALQRDINFAHEMSQNWLQKGPFSSVDKGQSALNYAKRCEDASATLRSLASRLAAPAGEWRPWKPGDLMPLPGTYWTTCKDSRCTQVISWRTDRNTWEWAGVIAYWSAALPTPYEMPKPYAPPSVAKGENTPATHNQP